MSAIYKCVCVCAFLIWWMDFVFFWIGMRSECVCVYVLFIVSLHIEMATLTCFNVIWQQQQRRRRPKQQNRTTIKKIVWIACECVRERTRTRTHSNICKTLNHTRTFEQPKLIIAQWTGRQITHKIPLAAKLWLLYFCVELLWAPAECKSGKRRKEAATWE